MRTKYMKWSVLLEQCIDSFRTMYNTLLLKYSAAAFCSQLVSLPRNGSERHSESLFLFFVARKGIPSCDLFRGMVWNGIPRICIYFGSTERNSELCSLPQNGSEQKYESLLLFFFHGTEFRVIPSSAEGFGTEFRDFLFRGTTGIPSEITICSVYSVFRGSIFLSEIPNPSWGFKDSPTRRVWESFSIMNISANSKPKEERLER